MVLDEQRVEEKQDEPFAAYVAVQVYLVINRVDVVDTPERSAIF